MAGVVGAAVAGRVQGGSNESPAVVFTCVAESDSSATYVFRECDAAAFKGPRGELVGAPMKVVGSYILDHQVKNDSGQVTREAYIEVLPPRNLPFVPAAKQKMRRFNDRKTLTELGRQALARPGGTKKGMPGAASVVFRIETKCSGTCLCDTPASIRAEFRSGTRSGTRLNPVHGGKIDPLDLFPRTQNRIMRRAGRDWGSPEALCEVRL